MSSKPKQRRGPRITFKPQPVPPGAVVPPPSPVAQAPADAMLEVLREACPGHSFAEVDTAKVRSRVAQLSPGLRSEWSLSEDPLHHALLLLLTWKRRAYLTATAPRRPAASPQQRRRALDAFRKHVSSLQELLAVRPDLRRAIDRELRSRAEDENRAAPAQVSLTLSDIQAAGDALTVVDGKKGSASARARGEALRAVVLFLCELLQALGLEGRISASGVVAGGTVRGRSKGTRGGALIARMTVALLPEVGEIDIASSIRVAADWRRRL